ncbi:YjzC family protein [Fodinisporobacter ferrooxydans]|uniref:YjzC family protein n=1 Tax=Fodinisporobacter ferrooxydans TaxID=2901836 RepID=A0ABY4CJE2_9BACL|nr:YjzC family protein [Alicyclobacillaceae bacterium MYW30-H2]
MGQRNQFGPGDKVPNNGVYIEIGERAEVTGVSNPKKMKLHKGDRFPDTTNEDRKWTRYK